DGNVPVLVTGVANGIARRVESLASLNDRERQYRSVHPLVLGLRVRYRSLVHNTRADVRRAGVAFVQISDAGDGEIYVGRRAALESGDAGHLPVAHEEFRDLSPGRVRFDEVRQVVHVVQYEHVRAVVAEHVIVGDAHIERDVGGVVVVGGSHGLRPGVGDAAGQRFAEAAVGRNLETFVVGVGP